MQEAKKTDINGVLIVPKKKLFDDRGGIFHMLRSDDPEFQKFGEIYFSKIHPGVIKAWHHHSRMTYLLAGGGNFAFKTGRHVKLASPNDPKKTSQHRLLTSISQAFGRQVDKVGNFDPASGPLAGL